MSNGFLNFFRKKYVLSSKKQVGNQIRTAPELRIKIRPIPVYDLIHGNQSNVLREEQTAAEKSERDNGDDNVC